MLKKIVATLLLSAAAIGTTSAFAQSVNQPPVGNPFDGFYAGVHVGYGTAETDEAVGMFYDDDQYSLDVSGTFANSLDGATLGAQAGVNVVLDQGLVVGGEVSVSWAALQRSGDDFTFQDIGEGYVVEDGVFDASIDGTGVAELKLGYATDAFMVYGSVGVAVASVTSTITVSGYGESDLDNWVASHTESTMMPGWTVGVGGAMMVTPTTSVNLSVNYADFGTVETTGTGVINEDELEVTMRSIGVTATTVKVGINHHF